MSITETGSTINLADLRSELASRLALWLVGGSWLALLYAAFTRGRFFTISLLIFLIALGVTVIMASREHPRLARHLLLWGLTLSLMAAMWLVAEPWLPFVGLLLTFSGAMLVNRGGLIAAAAIAITAMWLSYSQDRPYPLSELLIVLALGFLVTWLSVGTLYTALQWTRTSNQRANELLRVVSDQQVELKRTVKSLEQVNNLQRRTQHELVLARRRAEEARRITEQFAANISHELRTPLNLILGFSEMMQLSPETYGEMRWPPKLRQAVYQIYRSSRHLMGMIDDILDLSRFEIGGFSLNYEPTPLEPLLQDTVGIVAGFFHRHQIELEVEISRDLPTLEIDRTRIRQVLLNLLNNARRFTEAGTVRLDARQVNREVVISVTDTGPGIPADKLPHIFEEFYQVDGTLRRSHSGTGLGLAICKRFVEAHQGRIWVESEVGAGSTFFFTLPLLDHPGLSTSAPAARPLEPTWAGMEAPILVVDSDPAVAALARRHLEGYRVVQVPDTRHLAGEILAHHPRAVVYNVPPSDQPSNSAADISQPVPVIQCSLPSLTWAAEHLGVAACLNKPVTGAQLLAEIDRLENVRQVLTIDDEQGFCQLIKQILETTGRPFEVQYAHNGQDGLEAIRTHLPDLVLLDMMMPDLDGLQVLEKMRQEPGLATIPVILLTATGYMDDALAQRSSQVVISRPDGLRLQEVLNCIRAAIEVLEPRYDERSAPETATK
jgi:signal transduction histidine kinase/CheY-like chemotaxis protein